jgi:hypothetical protein
MSERASGVVLPLSIVVSVAVGVVLGGMFARGSAGPAASTSLSLDEAKELTEAIHALRLEMERAREPKAELTVPPPTSVPSRVDASPETSAPSTDVAKELREATAEFVQAVGRMKSSLTHAGPESPPPVFPSTQSDGALVSSAALRSAEQNNKAYLFWTYQQVIDAFGAPAGTGRDKEGAILWWYNGQTDGTGINFWFVDGRVFRVEASN